MMNIILYNKSIIKHNNNNGWVAISITQRDYSRFFKV